MGGVAGGPVVTIPSVFVSQASGEALSSFFTTNSSAVDTGRRHFANGTWIEDLYVRLSVCSFTPEYYQQRDAEKEGFDFSEVGIVVAFSTGICLIVLIIRWAEMTFSAPPRQVERVTQHRVAPPVSVRVALDLPSRVLEASASAVVEQLES